MGAARFFLRTSTARFLAPVGLLVAVAQIISDGGFHDGWNDAVQDAVNDSLYLAVAVAVAVSVDARLVRSRWPALESGTRRLSPAAGTILAGAAWGSAGLCVVCAIAFVATAVTVPFMMPNLLLVVVGIAWVAESASVGWLLGTHLPFFLAVPAMVLVGWLGNALLAIPTGRLPPLFTGLDDGAFLPGYQPSTPVLVAQVLLMAGVGSACLLLARPVTGWQRSVRRTVVASLTGCLAAGFGLVAVVGTDRAPHAISPHRGACVAHPVAACSWPEGTQGRDRAAALAGPMWRSLTERGLPAPAGLAQDGLSTPDGWVTVSWPGGTGGLTVGTAESVARSTLAFLWCPASTDRIEPVSPEVRDRELWLAAQAATVDSTRLTPAARRMMSRPYTVQARWLNTKPDGVICVPR